ncbi:unnamed protein product [Brachionus calyciflorus]|uniref:BTB domain-containing protein n=1 Tax=Brachionus calyciflorus TaxID=104777 RepID=A0A813TL03_9BILA|nr:unnamed protein product [Brachionus calyciflorus]
MELRSSSINPNVPLIGHSNYANTLSLFSNLNTTISNNLSNISLNTSQNSTKIITNTNKILSSVENFADPNWSSNGFQNMEEIRRLGKLCDITLMAQDHKYTAHRIVLAASIPYFNAMFLHDLIESKQDVITINNIDPSALEQFINYSYNGKITITNENVQALLIGANFFHLKTIKNACCEFVKKRLNVQDALCLRNFADQLMCHDLVLAVNRFINKNFLKIVQTQEFLGLSHLELGELLCRDELNVDCEEQVYEALLTWVKNDEANRIEHLFDLLKLIRLPLVVPVYLVETIGKEVLIRNNLKSRDLLDEAIYYHLLPDKRNKCKTFNLKPRCCNDAFGLIYAIGGINSTGGSVSTVEVYDCTSDRWRLADLMVTTRSRVAVAVLQGKLYAIGGYNGLERLSTVEVFEPDTKKWRRVASISKPRSALGSAVLNNKLYVCGGYDGFASSDTVEMYDPKNDKWTILSNMRKHRSATGITAFNSMIYAAGGHDGYRIYDSVECYDTQKDTWSFVASMKTKRCRLGLAGLNGKLYAAGGYDSLNFLNTVERYDPIEDKWEFVSPMNVKRSRMALVTCNSKLYAIGGYDGICNLSSVEMYDPEKDQWTMVSQMIAHEGVVGVGVLPYDVDLPNPNDTLSNSKKDFQNQNSGQVNQIPLTNNKPMFNNYYSLMEEEEEENNQFTTIITPNGILNQNNRMSN